MGMENHFVHPFASADKNVQPLPSPWTRPFLPYEANGGSNAYAQQDAAPKKDIANKEVRPDVYVTVHKMINPVALGRYREPRPAKPEETRTWDEGPKPKEKPTPEFKFKKPEEPDADELKAKREAAAAENKEKAKAAKAKQDEEDAKPDEEAAGAAPTTKEAKEPTKEEKEKDEAAKKAEKKESLAQVQKKEDKKGEEEKKDGEDKPADPEKVHVLEPTEYQEKANTNSPNLRTTFYDKKNQKKAI